MRNALITVAVGLGLHAMPACTPSSSGTDEPTCDVLAACCLTMSPAAQEVCTPIVASGLDPSCVSQLATYQASGHCLGDGGPGGEIIAGSACGALSVCCGGMSGPDQQACDIIASSGVAMSCSTELAGYVSAGMCSGATEHSSTGSGLSSGGESHESLTSGTFRETSHHSSASDDLDGGDGFDSGEHHPLCTQFATKFCNCLASGGIEGANCMADTMEGCNEDYDMCSAVYECILNMDTCNTNCGMELDASDCG